MEGGGVDDVETAIEELFKAYDLDESGELTRDEFLGIEMRLCFEKGEVFRGAAGAAKMTLADKDSSGTLDFDEFRNRFLTNFQEMDMSRAEIVSHLNEQTQLALLERAKMGPRYHAGIRQALRQIFSLFDVSGDDRLSPEEWIAAQKTVALEVSDDLDEGWVDEAAFGAADTNKDGMLDLSEFLESSFQMFEGVKKRTEVILSTLQRVVKVLEQQRLGGRKETSPVTIFVQTKETPVFLPPQQAWQDESTVDEAEKWQACGEVALPLNLATADDVAALVRLFLKIPADTWLSIFYLAAPRDGGPRPVTLLRGERPGEGNVQAMLQYMTKTNAELRLYVKNARKRPQRLVRQPRAFLEERDQLLNKRTGQSWGLDWETQLVGEGQLLPPRPMVVSLGDAVVVEVPVECGAPLDRYKESVFMDRSDVLSKPVDENITPKVKKKSKKKPASEPDPLLQLSFVAMKEGKCVFFVDVSWEDQEEKLALEHELSRPVHENSVARIGPVEVEVTKPTGGKPDASKAAGAMVWWNGEKWSNKKGPAKRKGKKR
mmetsp:Transcript_135924/g.378819  ORF Transcript_135924/g.378819 Transcript_135924/m.378819 type:complete len:545 (-) Transcript_135924:99-1733(-)|eukprot:CAMPEP_0179026750 /NCGR_PEP_ID=MMETSP0796-20121207/8681_1 /TAXON_ID=73915 /ORGANISM="Pyrodinium bahamense, Strain pbaha01" /LENGTH=544 /DNA_ID=CAMNT_0020722851 /DNA_START=58 /DNA_END=1692 /DNA_ORIENTATION=+